MYTQKQYSEPSIFNSGNIKTIIGIILSILVFLFAILVIMLKTNFALFGLTIMTPDDDDLLALDPNALVFMKEINQSKLPPRGELVTFNNENTEIMVRVIDYEELESQTFYSVTGGGFVEHRIISTDLVKQGSFLIPNLGGFAEFLVTPAGLLICLGLPLVAILVLLLMHFMNSSQRTGDYKFSQVQNQGYFENAAANSSNKRQRVKKSKMGFNDPYAENYEQHNQWQNNNQQNGYGYDNNNQHPNNNQYSQNPNQNENYYQDSQYSSNNYDNQNDNQRKRPTIESILADVTGNSYNFDDDDYELDYAHNMPEEPMPLNYTKPETVNTDPEANNLIVTREFFIAELQPEEVTKAHEYSRGVGFQANLNDYEKNNFNIDGIDVNVDSNNIQLAITEDNDSDIFITVTEEFTNVVVNKENLETSFALFKDDEDEKNKVIIRKKQLG